MFDTSLTSGIGLISTIFAITLVFIFKSRNFGLFDPLNFFLITRVAPMLASLVILIIENSPSTVRIIPFCTSAIIFVATLYLVTPKAAYAKSFCGNEDINYLLRCGLILLMIKIGILCGATGSLPIFSEGGSDAYIGFDVDNKLGSSFLLGLGSADIVLFAFVVPLIKKGRLRIFVFLILLLAMLLAISSGKKSSILAMLSAVAFGEYLRIALVSNQKTFFIRKKNILIGIAFSVFWAALIYSKTSGGDLISTDNISFDSAGSIADFVFFQWGYAYFLFTSNGMDLFFQNYNVNKLTYFFHSIISPLGFPAFHASIGPAIHEFLTGELTGNGINPSFVVEGYVLLGSFSPLYGFISALIIGLGRLLIMSQRSLVYKVAVSALLLPALYTFASDGLLFAKIFYIVVFVVFFVVIPLRAITHEL